MISVFCDGSSTGKSNKPGGWAYIIIKDGNILVADYGGNPKTTNNRMELQAAINGLKEVIRNNWNTEEIELVSDSMYTLNIANKTNNPVANLDLALELQELYQKCNAHTRHVYGHTGDLLNARCDQLAKLGKKENPI